MLIILDKDTEPHSCKFFAEDAITLITRVIISTTFKFPETALLIISTTTLNSSLPMFRWVVT